MLLLFCSGIFIGTAFCMKWVEPAFLSNGSTFSIIGLEITYPREKVLSILGNLSLPVKTNLQNHLVFDFVFMAGVYPGIAALCMMARKKVTSNAAKNLFLILALLQAAAWFFDIRENLYLLNWLNDTTITASAFDNYHQIVFSKWILALVAILLAVIMLLLPQKPTRDKSHFLI